MDDDKKYNLCCVMLMLRRQQEYSMKSLFVNLVVLQLSVIVGYFIPDGEVISIFKYIGIFGAVHCSQSQACTVLCTMLYNADNNNMKDV